MDRQREPVRDLGKALHLEVANQRVRPVPASAAHQQQQPPEKRFKAEAAFGALDSASQQQPLGIIVTLGGQKKWEDVGDGKRKTEAWFVPAQEADPARIQLLCSYAAARADPAAFGAGSAAAVTAVVRLKHALLVEWARHRREIAAPAAGADAALREQISGAESSYWFVVDRSVVSDSDLEAAKAIAFPKQ